jgi:hypothetical protein
LTILFPPTFMPRKRDTWLTIEGIGK